MVFFAIFFIVSAALAYTISIWAEKFLKGLHPWMVKLFTLAFCCDLVGTCLMFCCATVKLQFNFHSLCGYSALVIMGFHLYLARVALKHQGKAAARFHRFSIWAWVIWMITFISGIPKA